ncbi:MAG: 2-alkenal reductase [Halieaceae bacterium]|jgi:S1-C subfamily serine protease|nr:2-alkenal reductase [Halieaceae bacterium]MDG1933215.1 trypsin-like peptidase domain-containing protein [Luminiphilus sp.]MDG2037641.1 trypsin-like peptidase domain-containing protein [Luminiphilus sp.]RZO79536.1 MAG: trypsin-like serine protease [Halieaceae bacterium]|tara:strand:+ start:2301 stop:3374 length:1074 start_codon:yes stop_codon:yes gene_type:complete
MNARVLLHACLGAILFLWHALPLSATEAPDYLSFSTDDEANTTEVFQLASPAVVFVTSTELRRQRFTRNVMEIPRGAGSGFIWNADSGLVVTNYHVVAGADRLTITLEDEQAFQAEVVGLAPERDLAVLRMMDPPDNLTELPVGDSSELSVGRKVMAIGNPFGLDTTLTVGVVSALDREIQSPSNRTIRGVIQTDAAINPGNSGGPLLNSLGQLIGVNTAIYSPSGGSAGIGFAIPVNTVIEVVPQLIAFGKIMRPVLGVELASDRWLRRYRVEGVPIVRTYRGFPAEMAGMVGARRGSRGEIILGDVITEIDGERVANNDEFLSEMERHRVGDTIDIVTTREGEEKRFTVELSEVQ